MNNKPDIGLINTHPKSNGSYYNLYIFVQKLILPVSSQFTIKPGMIGYSFNVISHKLQSVRSDRRQWPA